MQKIEQESQKFSIIRGPQNWNSVGISKNGAIKIQTPNPFDYINQQTSINYLEIGVFQGQNLFKMYELLKDKKDSKLHGIDPWIDHKEYSEYKDGNITQSKNKQMVLDGIKEIANNDIGMFTLYQGFSHKILPKLEDNFYDIIYIDGNHNPSNVCEDAVLSFRKLKIGGWIVFDDWGWGGWDLTARGIRAFADAYSNKLNFRGCHQWQQIWFQKKSN